MARDTVALQLALHNDLRSDACVVRTRLPQGVGAAHPVVTGQGIHQCLVETMPHVQRARDVGGWQQNAERFLFGWVVAGSKVTAVFPGLVPAAFDIGGL